jgi:hypothetical protein
MRKQLKLVCTSLCIVSAVLCHGQSVETQPSTTATKIETKQQNQLQDSTVYVDQSANDVAKPTTVYDTNMNRAERVKQLSNSFITGQFRDPARNALYKKDYCALISSVFHLQRKLYTLPYWFI